MAQVRRNKSTQGGKEAAAVAEDSRPRAATVSSPTASDKPKSGADGGGSAWNKPPGGAPRPHASSSSSSANGSTPAKAKAPPKTPFNIAAMAARNLGGFVPNKIFVGGVPITCSEDQFKAYFEPYGAISKVELHALRGFGYITYESVEAVDACLEKYEDHYLSKKWVEVKRSIPRELIDSYEREQRRLHAEYLAAEGGGGASPSNNESTKAQVDMGPGFVSPAPHQAAPSPSASTSVSGGLPSPGTGPGLGVGAAPTAARKGGGGWGAGGGGGWGAGGGKGGPTGPIKQLTEMGFSEEVAKRVLSECVWDVNKAIDRLLTDETLLASVGAGGGDDAPAPEPASPVVTAAEPPLPGSPTSGPAWGKQPVLPAARGAWGKAPPPMAASGSGSVSPSAGTVDQGLPAPGTSVWGKPLGTPTAGGEAPRPPAKIGAWGKPPAAVGSPKAKQEAAPTHAGYVASGDGDCQPETEPVARDPPEQAGGARGSSNGIGPPVASPPEEHGGGAVLDHTVAAELQVPIAAAATPAPAIAPPPPPAAELPGPTSQLSPAPSSLQESPVVAAAGVGFAGPAVLEAAEGLPAAEAVPVVEDDAVSVGAVPVDVVPSIVGNEALEATGTAGIIAAAVAPEKQVPAAPATTAAVAPPKKRIMRAMRQWDAEDSSQLSVVDNEFVNVWIDTGTDHGWIHAERRSSDGQIGWLPLCVLKQMPEQQLWMATKETWQGKDESQCNIEEGSIVLVWTSTRTAEGWCYVEVEDNATMKPGWLPVFCLDWNED